MISSFRRTHIILFYFTATDFSNEFDGPARCIHRKPQSWCKSESNCGPYILRVWQHIIIILQVLRLVNILYNIVHFYRFFGLFVAHASKFHDSCTWVVYLYKVQYYNKPTTKTLYGSGLLFFDKSMVSSKNLMYSWIFCSSYTSTFSIFEQRAPSLKCIP